MSQFDVLILQHHPESPAGSLLSFLETQGLSYRILALESTPLKWPELAAFRVLVILGGVMNVDEEDKHDWLIAEKSYLKSCFQAGKKIFGICLGAQLMAEVLGGKAYRHSCHEVGWHEIQWSAKGPGFLQQIEPPPFVFQWHGYRFESPPMAQKIASNLHCPDQGFVIDKQVVCFQFHPEVTVEKVLRLAERYGKQLETSPSVQSQSEIIAGVAHQNKLEKWFHHFLEQWLCK